MIYIFLLQACMARKKYKSKNLNLKIIRTNEEKII